MRYALNTTSTANLTTLNRNATVPFTYSTTTAPRNEYVCLYYTDTTLLAYKKSMNASVAPALTPSFSATLGTPSTLRYPISFSFTRDRAQKCQVAFVVEGNDGVRKNFGPATSVIGESTYSDDVSSFTNNRASLQLTLKGRTATTDSTLSTPQTVTLTLQFRAPVILIQSGL